MAPTRSFARASARRRSPLQSRRSFRARALPRLDRDVASGAKIEGVLARVARREIDILVGTQMVTKGHDFPGVTLVGVLCADTGLDLPDFRASERTFQLLAQVAGRAGRGQRPGRVVVQTYRPTSHAVTAAAAHDYAAFFASRIGGPSRARLSTARAAGRSTRRWCSRRRGRVHRSSTRPARRDTRSSRRLRSVSRCGGPFQRHWNVYVAAPAGRSGYARPIGPRCAVWREASWRQTWRQPSGSRSMSTRCRPCDDPRGRASWNNRARWHACSSSPIQGGSP